MQMKNFVLSLLCLVPNLIAAEVNSQKVVADRTTGS